MSEQDAEIEWLKAEVNCAALLSFPVAAEGLDQRGP
jgi:hypothetical protein